MSLDFLKRLAGMTRETKLGLVVACSFLSLLGVVLFLKMNERDDAASVSEVREGNVWGAIWDSAAKTDPAKPGNPAAVKAPVSVASADGKGAPGGGGLPALPGNTPPKVLPREIERVGLVEKPADPLAIPGLPPAVEPRKSEIPGVPSLPPPTESAWAQVWSGTAIKDGSLVSEPAATVPGLPPPVSPVPTPKQSNVWAAVWAGAKKNNSWDASLGLPPVEVATTPSIPGLPPSTPDKPPPLPLPGRGTETTGNTGLPGLPSSDGASKPPPRSPVDVAEIKPITGDKAAPNPPPVGGTSEGSKPLPGLPDLGAPSEKTPKPPPIEVTFPEEKTPKEPLPKVGSLPPSGTERTGTPPPRVGISLTESSQTTPPVSIGGAPGRTVPPIGVTPEPQRAPRGPQPQVIEYMESMHKIQPGETFEKISLDQYGSKDYADALLLYNRGHPIVGENFVADNAPLTPGQRIFLPSNKELLESRYPAAIKGVATHTQSNAPPVEPVQPKAYTVGAGGESFARIAQKLFENVDRWPEIRNLNRELDPEKPIPAGTILKVPGDARTP